MIEDPLLKFWRCFGECGFALVIIGVIGEVIAAGILQTWEHNRKDYENLSGKWKYTLEILERVSGAVLIVGLVMEYHGHQKETYILDADNAKLYETGREAEKKAEQL